MVIDHIGCDLEKVVHPLIFVAQGSGRVWTEARFVRIDCNSIALVDC